MAPRVDSHVHFWRYAENASDYPWIGSGMEALKADRMPADLAPELEGAGVSGVVAVQARETLGETQALLALAEESDLVAAVVGWIDICAPDAQRHLETFAESRDLKGLRLPIHDRPDPGFADTDAHRRGVGLLDTFGLTYDLLLRPDSMPAAIRLVDAWPEQPFVVDHIAKPDLTAAWNPEWADRIAALAERPNVFCKLSGLVTEARWSAWREADYRRHLDHCLEAFGAERLMMGSDWPVCTLAASYAEATGIVFDWAAALSAPERDAVLGLTCQRFYGITTS